MLNGNKVSFSRRKMFYSGPRLMSCAIYCLTQNSLSQVVNEDEIVKVVPTIALRLLPVVSEDVLRALHLKLSSSVVNETPGGMRAVETELEKVCQQQGL